MSIDGKVAGAATVANGAWTFAPSSPLSNGSHAITATQAAAGGASSAAATDNFTVKIATPPPAAPTITSPAANSIDSATAKPVISGAGITGDTVTVSIDGKVAGAATVANGAWTFTPSSPLSNGSHAITATQAAAGGASSAAATDSFTVKIATPPPAAPTITSPVANSIDTTTAKPVISGAGITGDTVTVSIDGKVAGAATVANGAWTFTPSSPLSNGSHAITATQAAAGGASSAAATDSFTVKIATPPPAAPTLTIADTSLSVDGGGGTVDLGIGVTAPSAATDVTVAISGLRRYETISDGLGDTFHGKWITLTEAQVDSGLTLTSNYDGSRNPVNTLNIVASDTMGGVTSSSMAQSMTVTDPGTSSSHHRHGQQLALLSQYMAGDASGGSSGALQTASAATEADRSSFVLSVLRH